MSTDTSQSATTSPHSLSVLNRVDVNALPWRPVPGSDAVRYKELWHGPDTVCALIAYDRGATTPGPPHAHAEHHIWVVHGVAQMAGRRLAAGSYVHVPAGSAHHITAGLPGCTLLQVHHQCQGHM